MAGNDSDAPSGLVARLRRYCEQGVTPRGKVAQRRHALTLARSMDDQEDLAPQGKEGGWKDWAPEGALGFARCLWLLPEHPLRGEWDPCGVGPAEAPGAYVEK